MIFAPYLIDDDYIIHYFRTHYLVETLIPKFRGVFGFNNQFYAGFPSIQIYPIGFYLSIAFLTLFGLNIVTSMKVIVFITFYLFVLLPYYLVRQLKGSGFAASLAVFILTFAVPFQVWYSFFDAGMIPFIQASILGLIFIFKFSQHYYNRLLNIFYMGNNNEIDIGNRVRLGNRKGKGKVGDILKSKINSPQLETNLIKDSRNSDQSYIMSKNDKKASPNTARTLKSELMNIIFDNKSLFFIILLSASILCNFMVIFLYIPVFLIEFFAIYIRLVKNGKIYAVPTKGLGNSGNSGNSGNCGLKKSFFNFIQHLAGFLYNIKNLIYYLLIILILAGCLVAFWGVPNLLIQYKYVLFPHNESVFSFETSMSFFKYYKTQYIWLFLINCIIALILFDNYSLKIFKFKKNMSSKRFGAIMSSQFQFAHNSNTDAIKSTPNDKQKQAPYSDIHNIHRTIYIALISEFFVFIMPFAHIHQFLGVNSVRYFTFFELLAPVLLVIYIEKLIDYIKADLKKLILFHKYKVKSAINLKMLLNKDIRIKIITLLIIFLLFIFRYSKSLAIHDNFGFGFLNNYSDLNYPNRNTFKPEVVDMINWIKTNTTPDNRILIENSGEESDFIYGAAITALLPELTNRSFIGGYLTHFWFKFAKNNTCKEKQAFGVPFEQMNISFFENKLKFFNIRPIIVWSQDAKNFLNSYPDKFEFMVNFSQIFIYIYKYPSNTYVFPHSNNNYFNYSLLEFSSNHIKIRLQNISKGDYIVISLHNYYNWFVKCNNSPPQRTDPNSEYLTYSFNADYDLVYLEFIWKTSNIEIISNLTSIFAISFIFSMIIYSKLRNLKKGRKF
ncbi:MAG: hypothetical protein ACTSU2_11935 [Promethearchaeota archaeon]